MVSSAVAVVALCACDPDDVPRFSPGCTSVAVLLDSGKDKKKDIIPIAVLDLPKGEWRRYDLPERWSAEALVWAGPRVLITADRPKAEKSEKEGKPTHDVRYWLLDPATGKFHETKLQPRIFSTPFTGPWKGKACLFIRDPERNGTQIVSLPDLAEVETLAFEVQAAGEGWLTRELKQGEKETLLGIEVLDSEGKNVCTIPREEIAKACHRDARVPECARVSSDGKHIVLGFDTQTIFRQAATEYTFGVFNLADGKLAWRGGTNALHGLPVMIGDAIYILEAKSRKIYIGERTVAALGEGAAPRSEPTSEVVLARHTAAGRSVVIELPLKKTDRAARYSASPDRKSFVLLVEGDATRLLVVPIGQEVVATDLREFPLKDK